VRRGDRAVSNAPVAAARPDQTVCKPLNPNTLYRSTQKKPPFDVTRKNIHLLKHKTPRYGVHDVKIETDDVVRTVFPEGALRKLGSLGVKPNPTDQIGKMNQGIPFR